MVSWPRVAARVGGKVADRLWPPGIAGPVGLRHPSMNVTGVNLPVSVPSCL